MNKKKIILELKARKRDRQIVIPGIGGNPIEVNQAAFKNYTDNGAQMLTKFLLQKKIGKYISLGENLLIRARRAWTASEARVLLGKNNTNLTYGVICEKSPLYGRHLTHEIVNAIPQDPQLLRIPQGIIVLRGAEVTNFKPKSLNTARVIRLKNKQ